MSKDKCHDLKNLQYKTLLNKKSKLDVSKHNQNTDNIINIEKLLENEKNIAKNNSWNKLDKTMKIVHLNNYVDNYLKHNLTNVEKEDFKKYLINLINRKQLQKKTDIVYNKKENKITDIPIINFNKETRKFKQKRSEKRTSTMSSLSKLNITRKTKRQLIKDN